MPDVHIHVQFFLQTSDGDAQQGVHMPPLRSQLLFCKTSNGGMMSTDLNLYISVIFIIKRSRLCNLQVTVGNCTFLYRLLHQLT